jgi:hypothetical protein
MEDGMWKTIATAGLGRNILLPRFASGGGVLLSFHTSSRSLVSILWIIDTTMNSPGGQPSAPYSLYQALLAESDTTCRYNPEKSKVNTISAGLGLSIRNWEVASTGQQQCCRALGKRF